MSNQNNIVRISDFLIFLIATFVLLPPPIPVSSSYSEYEGKINNHLQEGNNALGVGDLQTAIRNYEACLTLDPNQRYCNINFASVLVDLNESEQDESRKHKRMERAISLLRHVLRSHPKDGDAAFNLALLLQDYSRSEEVTREAATLYQIAVEETDKDSGEDDRWDALANMAAAKQELGEFLGPYGARRSYERAIVLLEAMVEEYKGHIDQLTNDADSFEREYDDESSKETQMQITSINAYLSKLYYGYGTIMSELSPSDCLSLMTEESLLMDTKDGTDQAQAKMVCESNAVNALRMAAHLDENNVVAMHMLAAMTGGVGDDGEYRGKERASNEFVSALFDDFADTFDEKLGALGYKVPQLVGAAAYNLLQMSEIDTLFQSALDAGCGTGLAGRFLRPLVRGPLVGVDLSKKMLELAAECTLTEGCGLKVGDTAESKELEEDERSHTPLYDSLVSLDLETASLNELIPGNSITGFDLIVAADVLVYFGDIMKLLVNFSKLSDGSEENKSFLIFSCERIEEEKAPVGWKLQSSGRYAHSKSYVTKVASEAGYVLIGYDQIVPRMEKGEDVEGHLFIFAIGGNTEEDDYVEVVETIMEEL